MKQSQPRIIRSLRFIGKDRRGAVALMTAASMIVLLAMAGFAIDVGNAISVQRALQSSSDAAALAGGWEFRYAVNANDPVTTATKYSSAAAGDFNNPMVGKIPVTLKTATMKCLKSVTLPCTGVTGNNSIQIVQTANVPTMFVRVLGFATLPVSATSTALAASGTNTRLNVEILLDTTASMNTTDPNCPLAGTSKIDCALAGVQTILNTLSPSADYVGLMVFPGVTTATAPYDTNCGGRNPTTVMYGSPSFAGGTATYQIVALSNDYRTSNSSKTLSSTSNLVKASGGASGCPGIAAPGGQGTYYADAINAAQAALVAGAAANPNSKNVLFFLSDGDANSQSGRQIVASEATNQCHEAITAAANAKAAGTEIFSFAYGSPTGLAPSSCSTDTRGSISACVTMQDIATSAGQFYSDDSAGCAATGINANYTNILSQIPAAVSQLTAPRLVPDNTS